MKPVDETVFLSVQRIVGLLLWEKEAVRVNLDSICLAPC